MTRQINRPKRATKSEIIGISGINRIKNESESDISRISIQIIDQNPK